MKKLAATIFGILLITLLGGVTQADQGNGNDKPVAIKGKIWDLDGDGAYDLLTFGVLDRGKRKAKVSYVEVTSLFNERIGTLQDVYTLSNGSVNWFFVDLRSVAPCGDFLLRIHLKSSKRGELAVSGDLSIMAEEGGEPQDPEETVLILKYP